MSLLHFSLGRKCCCWFSKKFCDTQFWNLPGILSPFSVDYHCFLRRLTPVLGATSPVTSTPWKASLFERVFVYDFFFLFCHFITQEEGCLQVIKDTPFWYKIFTFSADTVGFFDSITGFAFRSVFFGFVSDGFCFACRLDGSKDTFFIWVCKNNTSSDQIVSFLLQSNWENREHQKYFWNVIVLQEKSQSVVRKLNCKQEG